VVEWEANLEGYTRTGKAQRKRRHSRNQSEGERKASAMKNERKKEELEMFERYPAFAVNDWLQEHICYTNEGVK
jgi:hypothetical protein